MYYYLSIGSNIHPELSSVQITKLLCQEFGSVGLFPFRYTVPEGVESSGMFLNSLAVVYSTFSAVEVKDRLNAIEAVMGRDRADPLRSVKDRTADIDILGSRAELDYVPFEMASESYVKACFELSGQKADLAEHGLASHEGPASIYIEALTSNIVVIDDELDGFKDWVKTSFER